MEEKAILPKPFFELEQNKSTHYGVKSMSKVTVANGWTHIWNEEFKKRRDAITDELVFSKIKSLKILNKLKFEKEEISVSYILEKSLELLALMREKNIGEELNELSEKIGKVHFYSSWQNFTDFFSYIIQEEYYSEFDRLAQNKDYKDKIDEAVYKLHVNLPVASNHENAMSFLKELIDFLKESADSAKFQYAKIHHALISEEFSKLSKRFHEGCQVTIYLPSNPNHESMLHLINEINSIAKRNGIADMPVPDGDEKITTGVVSFRLDYDEDGHYVEAAKINERHIEQQKNHTIIKQLKEKLSEDIPSQAIKATRNTNSIKELIKKAERRIAMLSRHVQDDMGILCQRQSRRV